MFVFVGGHDDHLWYFSLPGSAQGRSISLPILWGGRSLFRSSSNKTRKFASCFSEVSYLIQRGHTMPSRIGKQLIFGWYKSKVSVIRVSGIIIRAIFGGLILRCGHIHTQRSHLYRNASRLQAFPRLSGIISVLVLHRTWLQVGVRRSMQVIDF